MPQDSVIYGVSRIRCHEKNLLGPARLQRMLDGNAEEAVRQLVDIVDEREIPVICYGLRTDFRGELFEGSRELLRWADTIEEIKTVCWCGRKATFNARVQNGHIVREGEQIMMGGNSAYVSLCRRHWKDGNLGSFCNLNLED